MAARPDGKTRWSDRLRSPLLWAALGLICLGAAIRISVALAAPIFSEHDPIGLFRSDPALLYYITERIIEHGGLPPDDFRADPRIEHPEPSDVPAMFTVGEEFLVAWAYLLFGGGVPLHLFALYFMSIVASTAVVGIVGLARELTGSRAWAALAGLIYVVTPGSYRTLGIVLIREDLSFPLFTLHLYLLARALRVRSTGSVVAAALAAVAALATWHAMSFVFTIEVACIFAWYLRTGENPLRGLDGRAGWIALGVFAIAGLLVPVLRSKLLLLSLPFQMMLVMTIAPALLRRTREGAGLRLAVASSALVVLAASGAGLRAWLFPEAGDYGHVVEMMVAKLRYLGELPRDPTVLSFGARLIWGGVFETSSPQILVSWLGVLALLTPAAGLVSLESWWRGRGDGRAATLAAFAAAALVLALLVKRLFALVAVLGPAVAVLLLRTSVKADARRAWVAALVLVQAVLAGHVVDDTMLQVWYKPTTLRHLASTLHFIRDELPGEGAVAGDFVVSSAVLAQTGHASVLQPKYETKRSRDRIERFTTSLYHDSPAAFRELLRREFQARYLLVDTAFLWKNRYMAGVPFEATAPPAGSAAWALLNNDRSVYGAIPGYRLLHESHPRLSRFRLYDLEDGG